MKGVSSRMIRHAQVGRVEILVEHTPWTLQVRQHELFAVWLVRSCGNQPSVTVHTASLGIFLRIMLTPTELCKCWHGGGGGGGWFRQGSTPAAPGGGGCSSPCQGPDW